MIFWSVMGSLLQSNPIVGKKASHLAQLRLPNCQWLQSSQAGLQWSFGFSRISLLPNMAGSNLVPCSTQQQSWRQSILPSEQLAWLCEWTPKAKSPKCEHMLGRTKRNGAANHFGRQPCRCSVVVGGLRPHLPWAQPHCFCHFFGLSSLGKDTAMLLRTLLFSTNAAVIASSGRCQRSVRFNHHSAELIVFLWLCSLCWCVVMQDKKQTVHDCVAQFILLFCCASVQVQKTQLCSFCNFLHHHAATVSGSKVFQISFVWFLQIWLKQGFTEVNTIFSIALFDPPRLHVKTMKTWLGPTWQKKLTNGKEASVVQLVAPGPDWSLPKKNAFFKSMLSILLGPFQLCQNHCLMMICVCEKTSSHKSLSIFWPCVQKSEICLSTAI